MPDTAPPTTLADGLQAEISRYQDLLAEYRAIGPEGSFGAAFIKAGLDRATAAILAGDVVEMIRAHEELKGFE